MYRSLPRLLTHSASRPLAAPTTAAAVPEQQQHLASLTATLASNMSSSVYGVGVDIAHIPRFISVLQRHGDRFLRKCLHPSEIALAHQFEPHSMTQARFVASRWAVKEAMIKATGKRLLFPHMHVTRQVPAAAASKSSTATDPRAKLVLTESVLEWFQQSHLNPEPHIALSHDGDYAVALAVVEKNADRNRKSSTT